MAYNVQMDSKDDATCHVAYFPSSNTKNEHTICLCLDYCLPQPWDTSSQGKLTPMVFHTRMVIDGDRGCWNHKDLVLWTLLEVQLRSCCLQLMGAIWSSQSVWVAHHAPVHSRGAVLVDADRMERTPNKPAFKVVERKSWPRHALAWIWNCYLCILPLATHLNLFFAYVTCTKSIQVRRENLKVPILWSLVLVLDFAILASSALVRLSPITQACCLGMYHDQGWGGWTWHVLSLSCWCQSPGDWWNKNSNKKNNSN